MKVEFFSRKPLLKRRQWYWRAKAPNGRIVAVGGEGYSNLPDAENGALAALKALGAWADKRVA